MEVRIKRWVSRACVVIVFGQLIIGLLHVCRVVEDVYAYNSAFCSDDRGIKPRGYMEAMNPFRGTISRNDTLASMPVSGEGRQRH